MSQILLQTVTKIKLPAGQQSRVIKFMQDMMDRFYVGHLRYGSPSVEKEYLKRLKRELRNYQLTGNQEHLLNVAVYCILETMAPQLRETHFDATAPSVTRNR